MKHSYKDKERAKRLIENLLTLANGTSFAKEREAAFFKAKELEKKYNLRREIKKPVIIKNEICNYILIVKNVENLNFLVSSLQNTINELEQPCTARWSATIQSRGWFRKKTTLLKVVFSSYSESVVFNTARLFVENANLNII